jgi:transcriptional regulator with XRE-family HTH domain
MGHTNRIRLTPTAAREIRARMALQQRYQSEVAEVVGVSQSTLSRWLLGQRGVPVDRLRRLTDCLELPREAGARENEEATPDEHKSTQTVRDLCGNLAASIRKRRAEVAAMRLERPTDRETHRGEL